MLCFYVFANFQANQCNTIIPATTYINHHLLLPLARLMFDRRGNVQYVVSVALA